MMSLVLLFPLCLVGCFGGENQTFPSHRPYDDIPRCEIYIKKSRVVSKGISSTITVKVDHADNVSDISAVLQSAEGEQRMKLKPRLSREFSVSFRTNKLGTSRFNVCVSDVICGCKEISVYSVPAPLTLLPPLLTVLMAIITRQVLLSLSCGIYAAAFISAAYNPVEAFIETFNSYVVLPFLDPSKSGVMIFCALMSGLIEIIEKAGGANGLANEVFKLASSPYHGSLVTLALAFCFFFDDFAAIMICGKSLGPLVTSLGLSSQKFSFIVHIMAVSMASICPLSSWAGIQIGYIESSFKLAGKEVSGFGYMVESIPYRFFTLSAMLSVIIYVCLNKDIVPTIGYEEDMRNKQKDRMRKASEVTITDSPDTPERWYNAVIPLLLLVVISIVRMYFDGKEAIENLEMNIAPTFLNAVSKCNSINALIIGTSVTLFFVLIIIPAQRILSFQGCLEYFVEGVKGVSEPIMILVLAWGLGIAMNDIHTSDYIAQALGNNMPPKYFPAVVCIIGYVMSYASGSSMGTQGILFPLIIPVVTALTEDETIYVKTVAAAFGSSVFGNLCSPIADTTIASVLFTGCPMVDHIKVMSTFCVPIALLSIIFGDLLVGISAYPFWVTYILISGTTIFTLALFGRSPNSRGVIQIIRDYVSGRAYRSESYSEDENTYLLEKDLKYTDNLAPINSSGF